MSQELRRKKRITTVGAHVAYMKAGSPFLEQGLPVQHPKWEHRPFESPPHSRSNPEAKASLTGKRDFTRLMERRSSKEAPDTFLFLLGLRQEDTRVLAKRGGGGPDRVSSDWKPWPRRNAARPRGRRTHRTKHSADRVGRQERRGKIHPSSSPLPGARDRWSRVLLFIGRRKMGFRGAYLNPSAKATGTETPAGENAQR